MAKDPTGGAASLTIWQRTMEWAWTHMTWQNVMATATAIGAFAYGGNRLNQTVRNNTITDGGTGIRNTGAMPQTTSQTPGQAQPPTHVEQIVDGNKISGQGSAGISNECRQQ